MLPSSKSYLIRDGYTPREAAFILISCFLGGVIGIQVLSRFLHHHMPSHVVDCDHTHEPMDDSKSSQGSHDGSNSGEEMAECTEDTEDTPLLRRDEYTTPLSPSSTSEANQIQPQGQSNTSTMDKRPTLSMRLTRKMTDLVGTNHSQCDEGGPCYGYSDPCGHKCFKVLSQSPTGFFTRASVSRGPQRPSFLATSKPLNAVHSQSDQVGEESENGVPTSARSERFFRGRKPQRQSSYKTHSEEHSTGHIDVERGQSTSSSTVPDHEPHHHHVAENTFLSIGLQTSIAIALHKLPEGFITYATNHANPKLGFAVFMALFIHNITEGFAMALPLYLAIQSRGKAMFWSSLLGGISQPMGAGIAALWFKAASNHDMVPSEGAYGCMFAITAGIMTSVALQLFSESLGLTHNKNLCVAFAFVGMGILGLSSALTAS